MTMDINIQQRVRVETSTALINSSSSPTSNSARSSVSPDSNRSPVPPNTPSYSPNLPTTTTTITPRSIKRSFDVAFLMAPDENLARKQLQQEKQLRLVSTGCLMNRTSPVPTHNTSPRSSVSPHNMVLNSHNPLLGGVTESIVPRAYAEHALLGDMTDSAVRNSSQTAVGTEVTPRQHGQRIMISTHQSKVGLFEHSGLLVPKTVYNHEDLMDRVSKSQISGSKSQDFNLINMTTSRSSFHHDDVLETCGKGQTDNDRNQNSASNTSTGVMIRSAFTKVTTSSTKFDASNLLNVPLPTSPSSMSSTSGGLSPDHTTYQESMSPPSMGAGSTLSPIPPHFMHSSSKQFQSSIPLLSPNHHLSPKSLTGSSPSGGKTLTSYSSAAFLLQQESNSLKSIKASNGLCSGGTPLGSNNGNFRNDIDSYLMKASITASNQHHHLYSANEKELLPGFPNTGSKLRPASLLYHHPESVAAYSTLAAAAYPFAANFSTTAAELLVTRAPPPSILTAAANPAAAAAAAVVSASLLPPSFAALSLPAQNVCAKCNISFRMTSDLVYHMRSHHKGDHINSDIMRRRRDQEKLKCPVCSESFRERHHLTRHMTAHQDKEGDMVEEADDGHRNDAGVEAGGRRRITTSAMMVAGHNAVAK
ncbi:serine-rich adhesin for platelets [Cryptotermes secundus]|nr:serine-rich adhesin for platelets [Cryptotermes secundus]